VSALHELRPVNRRLSALLLVLGWLLMQADSARAEVRIFDLQHRSAPELVPIVSPLLGSDGGVSALDNRLIVRADPKTLNEIARLVIKLDTPPRQLLITVRQGSHDRQQDAATQSAGQGWRIMAQTQGEARMRNAMIFSRCKCWKASARSSGSASGYRYRSGSTSMAAGRPGRGLLSPIAP